MARVAAFRLGRWLSIAILLFWGVMSVAHVRRVWFPVEVSSEGPPAEELFLRFLTLEDPNHTFGVFCQDRQIGRAIFSSRMLPDTVMGSGRRELSFQGTANLPESIPGNDGGEALTVDLESTIRGAEEVEAVEFIARLSNSDLRLEVNFAESGLPGNSQRDHNNEELEQLRYQIYQSGEVLLDSAKAGGKLAPSLLWLEPAFKAELARRESKRAGGRGRVGSKGVKTRIAFEKLAGRQRLIYVLEPDLKMEPIPFEIHLTEGGEIVRVRIFEEVELRSIILTMGK